MVKEENEVTDSDQTFTFRVNISDFIKIRLNHSVSVSIPTHLEETYQAHKHEVEIQACDVVRQFLAETCSEHEGEVVDGITGTYQRLCNADWKKRGLEVEDEIIDIIKKYKDDVPRTMNINVQIPDAAEIDHMRTVVNLEIPEHLKDAYVAHKDELESAFLTTIQRFKEVDEAKSKTGKTKVKLEKMSPRK